MYAVRQRRRAAYAAEPSAENHDRWLVSYADFITLLFAFFVVMYAASTVHEGKYRVLSDVLGNAFGVAPERARVLASNADVNIDNTNEPPRAEASTPPPQTLAPELRPLPVVQVKPVQCLALEDEGGSEGLLPVDLAPLAAAAPLHEENPVPPRADTLAEPLSELTQELETAIADLIRADLVDVRRNGSVVEVEIRDQMLFDSGSAVLNDNALEPLGKIAAMLREIPNRVQVEGFTDNVPINTAQFPSNWELSAGRAASVVSLLTSAGVEPGRLTAIGHGEFKPVADNATAAGRERNRRVVLVILGEYADDRPDHRHNSRPVPAGNDNFTAVVPVINLVQLDDWADVLGNRNRP